MTPCGAGAGVRRATVGQHGRPMSGSADSPRTRRAPSKMIYVMLALAAAATLYAHGQGTARDGLRATLGLFAQVGPVLVPAFLLAGMMSVVVSPEALTRFLGTEAGARGLVLGTFAGALTPGGPFVAFPLLAVLLEGGASVGSVTAYLSSWSLIGVHRMLAYEIPILGWRFVACRAIASSVFPIAIGWLAERLWQKFVP